MVLNLQQRYDRVNNSTICIYTGDFSVHSVRSITSLKDCVLVHTEGDNVYQDSDIFNLDELYHAEKGVESLCTELGI